MIKEIEKINFAKSILIWYKKNKRDLPWRKTKDPYKIWVSEIILQQTKISQGTKYYFNFIEKFPDLKTLSKVKKVYIHPRYKSWYKSKKNAVNHSILQRLRNVRKEGGLIFSCDEQLKK